jgi:hypothetical protein
MTANTELQTQAFNLYQETINLIKSQRKLFLDLGFVLKQIKEKKLYTLFGDGGFDTWRSFLANPEINLSPSTADVYIRVYEFYIEKLKLSKDEVLSIPLVRLNMMKATLEKMNDKDRGELIEKAKTLSYTDFKIETSGEEKVKAIKVTRCDKCSKLIVKYDPEQICDCLGGLEVTPYEN